MVILLYLYEKKTILSTEHIHDEIKDIKWSEIKKQSKTQILSIQFYITF